MKKKYFLLSLVLVAIFAMVGTNKVTSNITFPKAGNAGAPIDGGYTCGQQGCHPQPTHSSDPQVLNFQIGSSISNLQPLSSSFKYDAGTQYFMAFALNSFTGRWGFQVVALDNSGHQAGTFQVTDAQHTKVVTSPVTGSRQYMGHLNALSGYKNWSFKWTAPATTTGPITFYYTYNQADADSTPDGDIIDSGSVRIQPNSSGIEDINSRISSLNIFPNPISRDFSVSFDMKDEAPVVAQLYSLEGKLCQTLADEKSVSGLYNRTFDVSAQPAGIYLVKLNVGGASVTTKIIKQQ